MKKSIYSRIPMAAMVAAIFAVGVVGCSNNEEKSSQTGKQCPSGGKNMQSAKKAAKVEKSQTSPTVQAARNNSPAVVTKKPGTKVQRTANHKPSQVNVAAKTESEKAPSQTPEDAKSNAERRAETENLIYANIRVKMEEMIEERAELLKQGVPPSDPKIRTLEGSIMKARELLLENGEVVDEIEPPIVQREPRK